MTPFEIFATNGHLQRLDGAARPTARDTATVDDMVARRALTSVTAVDRWMRRIFHG